MFQALLTSSSWIHSTLTKTGYHSIAVSPLGTSLSGRHPIIHLSLWLIRGNLTITLTWARLTLVPVVPPSMTLFWMIFLGILQTSSPLRRFMKTFAALSTRVCRPRNLWNGNLHLVGYQFKTFGACRRPTFSMLRLNQHYYYVWRNGSA